MNGAESLVATLVGAGVDVCFANPGTSEMHFVAALDRIEGMRPILALFEDVATGAADGYGRMADKPAATLLHLGPGLANGLANLHNARRAATPIVNIELARVGARHPGPRALSMLDLHNPELNWKSLAEGMGVAASRATTAEEFAAQFASAMGERGPRLIEALI